MPYQVRNINEYWDLNYIDFDDIQDRLADPLSATLYENSPIFNIFSDKYASKYINKCLLEITPEDYYELVKLYFDIDNRQIEKYNHKVDHNTIKFKIKTQQGGARPNINDPIYKLLAIVDSNHDFKGNTIKFFRDTLGYSVPSELTANDLTSETNFINSISNLAHLTFDNKVIENPLYGFNINSYSLSERLKKYPESTFSELVNSQQKSLAYHKNKDSQFKTLEIWAQIRPDKNTNKKNLYYELRQLVYLCHFIKIWFKSYEFHIDNSHLVTQLIFLIKNVDNAFYEKFSNDPNVKDTLWNYLTDKQKTTINWGMSIADTNIFDGGIFRQMDLDYIHQTRYVYGGEKPMDFDVGIYSLQPFNIEYYLGLDNYEDINNYRDTNLKVHIEIIENRVKVIDTILDLYQCNQLFSIDTLYILIDSTINRNPDYIDIAFSAKINNINDKSPRFKKDILPHIKKIYNSCSLESLYSLKRAADWGHIEHCRQYSKVFVTKDRLAALYSYYRRVPFIFIKSEDIRNDSSRSNGILDNPPFIQLSHILYSPDI
jgi:hypothetical protein